MLGWFLLIVFILIVFFGWDGFVGIVEEIIFQVETTIDNGLVRSGTRIDI